MMESLASSEGVTMTSKVEVRGLDTLERIAEAAEGASLTPAEQPWIELGLTAAQYGRILEALGLPDVTALPTLDSCELDSQVEIVAMCESAIARANRITAACVQPLQQIVMSGKANVLKAVPIDAAALPHATYNVDVKQAEERKRDVATLLADLPAAGLPLEELAEIVYVKSIDVKGHCDMTAVNQLAKVGAKVKWDLDLRKADKYANKYRGKIEEIIEKATAPEPRGERVVVITPRESALKAVS